MKKMKKYGCRWRNDNLTASSESVATIKIESNQAPIWRLKAVLLFILLGPS